MDKVLDAFRNCITEPKCKDCPWEACEEFGNKKVSIPVDLALAVDRLLFSQAARIDELEAELGSVQTAKGEWTMPDREEVIKGIQECDLNGGLIGNCPYKGILALLQEQEAKPMIENEIGWNCPSCGLNLIGKTASGYPCDFIDLQEDEPIHFCPRCGQAVKWK